MANLKTQTTITHHCAECGDLVFESCARHPDAAVTSVSEVGATITRRHVLGYGSTSRPVQRMSPRGTSYLVIDDPREQETGRAAALAEVWQADCRRYRGGTDWACSLFVGGRRVLDRVSDVFAALEASGSTTVHLEPAL